MILQEIYNYAAKRVDKIDNATFFEELNRAYATLWYQIDTKDALFEMELAPSGERQVTLPWFVYDVKGVRDYYQTPLTLMTARPYYNKEAPYQSEYEWRFMHRTPLFRPVAVIGRLTVRPRKQLTKPCIVNLRGPGEFGVTEIETLHLAAGQRSIETSAVYSDLTSFTKSEMTTADLELFDAQNNKVGYLPADQTDVWCQVVQLTDNHARRTVTGVGQFYTVLYKTNPPRLSAFTDAIPTEYAIIIQDVIVESLLGGQRDEMSQKVADRAGASASGTLTGILNKSAEQFSTKVSTGRSPYYRRRHVGNL